MLLLVHSVMNRITTATSYMITVIIELIKVISQELYDKILENLDTTKITCCCGTIGDFIEYGHYQRTVKSVKETFALNVQRLKCRACGATHAVLPGTIVPYQQHSADAQLIILQYRLGATELEQLMTDNPEITESDVLRIRDRYKKHWEQRLNTMGMKLHNAISDLILSSFAWFNRQFLQIRRGVICKYCPPTSNEYTEDSM